MVLSAAALAIAWGALAFGAVYAWAWPPLLAVITVAGIVAWYSASSQPPPVVIAIAATGVLLAMSAQLIPLDQAVIAQISPGTDTALRQLDLTYAHADAAAPIARPLSLSPRRTAIGVLFFASASALTLGLARWLTRHRFRQIGAVITAVGGLMSLAAIAQKTLSPGVIYGIWQPVYGTDPFGPFVNKNHFAGWVLMGLPMALGLAAGLLVRAGRGRDRDWRARVLRLSRAESTGALLAAFAAVAMVIGLLMSLSRSGILAAAIGIAVAIAVTMRRVRLPLRIATVAAIGAMGLLAVNAVDTDRLAYRFASVGEATFASRLGMWRDTVEMASDFPVVGVGMRAYTVASLLYQRGLPNEHVGAGHSDWLQLIAEGGLLVGIPMWIVVALLTREARRRFREHRQARDFGTTYWLRAGAATGLFAIGLQSLVEFSLQMPGNTVLFAVLWALVIAPAHRPYDKA